MRSAISDRQRRHRAATSKALVRAVRYCKARDRRLKSCRYNQL